MALQSMKFSSREDIEAPIEADFDMVSDFPAFERSARKRGMEVRRTDGTGPPAVGMTWQASFVMRGRRRDATLTLVSLDRPTGLAIEAQSSGMAGFFDVDLLALSRTRTRLAVTLDLKPQTLAGRLLIQSMRLARTRLGEKFRSRVAERARQIEACHARSA